MGKHAKWIGGGVVVAALLATGCGSGEPDKVAKREPSIFEQQQMMMREALNMAKEAQEMQRERMAMMRREMEMSREDYSNELEPPPTSASMHR